MPSLLPFHGLCTLLPLCLKRSSPPLRLPHGCLLLLTQVLFLVSPHRTDLLWPQYPKQWPPVTLNHPALFLHSTCHNPHLYFNLLWSLFVFWLELLLLFTYYFRHKKQGLVFYNHIIGTRHSHKHVLTESLSARNCLSLLPGDRNVLSSTAPKEITYSWIFRCMVWRSEPGYTQGQCAEQFQIRREAIYIMVPVLLRRIAIPNGFFLMRTS